MACCSLQSNLVQYASTDKRKFITLGGAHNKREEDPPSIGFPTYCSSHVLLQGSHTNMLTNMQLS